MYGELHKFSTITFSSQLSLFIFQLYLDDFSRLFPYVVQIHYYDVPIICSQALIFGSYNTDFWNVEQKYHDVPLRLNLLNTTNRFEAWHDYRHNVTSAKAMIGGEEYCKEQETKANTQDQKQDGKSPGILMILESEDVGIDLTSSLAVENAIRNALDIVQFKVLDTQFFQHSRGQSMTTVSFDAGYIIARAFVESKYIAFDIHLWSQFDKHDALKYAIRAQVKAQDISSFRIVAGGMYGSELWQQDETLKGPPPLYCDEQEDRTESSLSFENEIYSSSLRQVLSWIPSVQRSNDEADVLVLCGSKTEKCSTLEMLSATSHQSFAIYECASLKGVNEYSQDGLEKMQVCQKEILSILEQEKATISAIIVDPNATFAMGQILLKLFSLTHNQAKFLNDNVVMMANKADDKIDSWKYNLLDRFRHDVFVEEPIFLADIVFEKNATASGSVMASEIMYISNGNDDFLNDLQSSLDTMQVQTGFSADVRNVQSGMFRFQHDFDPTQFFYASDYDQSAPSDQWKSQTPLGQHVVMQLEWQSHKDIIFEDDRVKVWIREEDDWFEGTVDKVFPGNMYAVEYDDGDYDESLTRRELVKIGGRLKALADEPTELTREIILSAVQYAMNSHEIESTLKNAELLELKTQGDGVVFDCMYPNGNFVVLWDGRQHLDISFFSYTEDLEIPYQFSHLLQHKIPLLGTMLRDEFPRGTGRVVNFSEDLFNDDEGISEHRKIPTWSTMATQ